MPFYNRDPGPQVPSTLSVMIYTVVNTRILAALVRGLLPIHWHAYRFYWSVLRLAL